MPQRKVLTILLLVVFVDMIGFGIVIPFLPFWAQHYGASPAAATMLMAVYAFFQFLFAIPLGALSDKIGRKPILLVSIVGSVLSSLLLAFADSLWMIFLARALAGAMAANIAVAQAYIADVTPPDQRAKGMALMGAVLGLGFICGPALGGLLAGDDPNNPNYQVPFLVSAGLAMVAFVGGVIFLRETTRQKDDTGSRGLRGRLRALKSAVQTRAVAGPILIALVIGIAMTSLESTFALWAERAHGWGPRQNGWFFAYIGVVLVITQGLMVGRLVQRYGEVRVLAAGVISLGFGMAMIPAALSLALLLPATGAVAVGYALSRPTISALTSKSAPPTMQGSVMGTLQSADSLSRLIGPILAGVLFGHYGRDAPYYVGAFLLAMALALVILVGRHVPVRAQK